MAALVFRVGACFKVSLFCPTSSFHSHMDSVSVLLKISVRLFCDFVSNCSLLHENPAPTQQDIEDNFDGNLCRCTGYRAILDSMKTFGVDSSAQDAGVIDIEVCDVVHLFFFLLVFYSGVFTLCFADTF